MDYAWFLFSFEGRINRAKYWLAGLIIGCWMIFLTGLVLGIAKVLGAAAPASFGFSIDDVFRMVDPAALRSAIDRFNSDDLTAATLIARLFQAIGTLLFLWVYAATAVKRLHDRHKSGWWMAAFFVVPGLYHQFEDRLGDSHMAALLGLIVGVLALWGFIEMLCLKGTRGPNRFGPDPPAPVDTRPRWDQFSELDFVAHSAGPSPASHVKRGHA
jgi:uncharacterized membrane protein YhaH (DUF805 family)